MSEFQERDPEYIAPELAPEVNIDDTSVQNQEPTHQPVSESDKKPMRKIIIGTLVLFAAYGAYEYVSESSSTHPQIPANSSTYTEHDN